jgi:hypothetical protein
MDHEYKIASSRGISALVNVYRLIEKLQDSGLDLKVCAQSIHIDLGRSDLFSTLLGGETCVGLISCFSELPDHIRAKFNVKTVEFYKLPGEQYFKEVIGAAATKGRHFPDVFNATMSRLERKQNGKIFLIAGGILGKFYVQQIKRSGGIALDIGSLADLWANKATRPGYENLSDLAL